MKDLKHDKSYQQISHDVDTEVATTIARIRNGETQDAVPSREFWKNWRVVSSMAAVALLSVVGVAKRDAIINFINQGNKPAKPKVELTGGQHFPTPGQPYREVQEFHWYPLNENSQRPDHQMIYLDDLKKFIKNHNPQLTDEQVDEIALHSDYEAAKREGVTDEEFNDSLISAKRVFILPANLHGVGEWHSRYDPKKID